MSLGILAVAVWAAGLAACGRCLHRRKPARAARKSAASTQHVSSPVSGKATAAVKRRTARVVPARPSLGQIAGLHGTDDPLDLKSSVALVIDQDTDEVLFSKNDEAVLPIASLTKLMTGLVVSEAELPMDEMTHHHPGRSSTPRRSSRSRLRVGAELTRGELLHLALMSSENRAAHALGRTYPGGLPALGRGDERQGPSSGHERHALRRTHRPVEPQPVERA